MITPNAKENVVIQADYDINVIIQSDYNTKWNEECYHPIRLKNIDQLTFIFYFKAVGYIISLHVISFQFLSYLTISFCL